MNYSNEEKRDMIRIYYRNNRNSTIASEIYFQNFPDRRQPDPSVFYRLDQNLGEYGSFAKTRRKYGNKFGEEDTALVLQQVFYLNVSNCISVFNLFYCIRWKMTTQYRRDKSLLT